MKISRAVATMMAAAVPIRGAGSIAWSVAVEWLVTLHRPSAPRVTKLSRSVVVTTTTETTIKMKPKIVIYVEGGLVTGILADTDVEMHVVDWDVVNDSTDSIPTLPDGLEYDDAGIRVVNGSWTDIAY